MKLQEPKYKLFETQVTTQLKDLWTQTFSQFWPEFRQM